MAFYASTQAIRPPAANVNVFCLRVFIIILVVVVVLCVCVCLCIDCFVNCLGASACLSTLPTISHSLSRFTPSPLLPLPYPRWLPGNFVNYKSFAFGSMLMSLPGTTPTSSAILLPMSRMTTMCVCTCMCVCVCVYFCITYATFYNSDSYATPPAHCPARNTRVVVLLCFIFSTHTTRACMYACVCVCVPYDL